MSSNYRYLFPFEKTPAGSRILIYGAGLLGQEYLKQLLITKYCEVVGFVDRNHASYPPMVVPVYAPEDVGSLAFDYVVVALRDGFGLSDICQVLFEQGVERERIVYVLERVNADPNLFAFQANDDADGSNLACDANVPSFGFYLAGGLGDMLYHKRFVMELLRFVPDAAIDIYAVKDAEYLEWLYSDCEQVRNILLDLGARYNSHKDAYSLSISIFGPKFLQVDHFGAERFKPYGDFVERIERLKKNCDDEAISHTVPGAVAYCRRVYNGENCYTWFNGGGSFSIDDFHVSIPFPEDAGNAFLQLGLGRYVTVNTGNGSAKDGKRIAKAWPVERFQQVVDAFRERYPMIGVVQLGDAKGEMLQHIDRHLMGKHFGLVAFALKHAIFHLDIEGGLVHLASQIGTKCIVLFGPTSRAYNAYENNTNIACGPCHGCYGLYSNADRCARHMEEPECMYSITPEIVMKEIDKHLGTMEKG